LVDPSGFDVARAPPPGPTPRRARTFDLAFQVPPFVDCGRHFGDRARSSSSRAASVFTFVREPPSTRRDASETFRPWRPRMPPVLTSRVDAPPVTSAATNGAGSTSCERCFFFSRRDLAADSTRESSCSVRLGRRGRDLGEWLLQPEFDRFVCEAFFSPLSVRSFQVARTRPSRFACAAEDGPSCREQQTPHPLRGTYARPPRSC